MAEVAKPILMKYCFNETLMKQNILWWEIFNNRDY